MRLLLLIYFLMTTQILWGKTFVKAEEQMGYFSGRVAKVNTKASLIRIRVDFPNMRYVNKRDKVEFWDEHDSSRRCKAFVAGKSNEFLLLKVPDFKFCTKFIFVAFGSYLKFFSQDLLNNISMGKELINILLKKRLALNGKVSRSKKDLSAYVEKVDAVNGKYLLLREKLEKEWREQIAAIEEDRIVTVRNFKAVQIRLDEVDHKLEKYRIHDENLKVDRWALDPRLYFRK